MLVFAGSAIAQHLETNGLTAGNPPLNPPVGPELFAYLYDDGSVETGVGITDPAGGTHDIIWLNRFPVLPGAEVIRSIQLAYGSPSDTRTYNGIPVNIVLYNDPDGGSTQNATLVRSINAVVVNANTGVFNIYFIPPTPVHNAFLVGVLAKNLTTGLSNTDPNARFLASLDTTPPHTLGASFVGFTDPGNTLNENNLASIPAGQYGTIEGFGLSGNWAIRAIGIPEPSGPALLGLTALLAIRRR